MELLEEDLNLLTLGWYTYSLD